MVWCEEHSIYHHGRKAKDICEYAKRTSISFKEALKKLKGK